MGANDRVYVARMAGAEKIVFKQSCGKNYYSRNEVERMRQVIGKARGKDMRMYECKNCHGWHLTKKYARL